MITYRPSALLCSLFTMADSRQATLMRIARGELRNQDFLFALGASHFSESEAAELDPNEKSWRARDRFGSTSPSALPPPLVRPRARPPPRLPASSLALRRTSLLVAGGRLLGEHVTPENGLKEERSVSHTKWLNRRRLGEWIAAASRTISFGPMEIEL